MALPHGVNVTEGALGAPPIELSGVSNIGFIGTAPDATGRFQADNKAYLITSRAEAAGSGVDSLGSMGTLPGALDGVYSQTRARVVFVKIPEYKAADAIAQFTLAETNWVDPGTDAPGDVTATNKASIYLDGNRDGVLRIQATPTTTPTLAAFLALSPGQEITIGGATTDGVYKITGSPMEGANGAVMYVDIRITETTARAGNRTDIEVAAQTEADATASQRTAAIGVAGDLTGVYALLGAQGEIGVKPSIIAASDLDTGTQGSGGTKNALGAALEVVAGRLRAIALIDGPGTTHADAITFAGDYSSDRTYLIDPKVKVLPAGTTTVVNRAASSYVAGLIVKNDKDRSWSASPSNQPLLGVLGTSRPIDYVSGDAASRAQLLNDAGIATIINLEGGYRLWGNETPASGDAASWKFLPVRRTGDVLYQSIQDGNLAAVDKRITKTYFEFVAERVNSLIRTLVNQDDLIDGLCYPAPGLNTEASIEQGQAHFFVRYTPVYPAQSVSFTVTLTADGLASLAA